MSSKRKIAWIAFVLLLAAFNAVVFLLPRESQDHAAVFREAVMGLKNLAHRGGWSNEGAWVGDVTELYRLGVITRGVAEADIAPLRPLVPKPRPFHGYQVVAMETAPGGQDWNKETVSLKGLTRCKENFAFCIYPIEAGKRRWVYIVTSMGMFGREATSNQPVLKWPTGDWRQEWAIID